MFSNFTIINVDELKILTHMSGPEADESSDNNIDLVADDSRQRELTEAKGTVVLHITHFAQYNPALVRDYIKFIRASTWLGEKLVTPFNLTLSLSLSSIERYEEQVVIVYFNPLDSKIMKLQFKRHSPQLPKSQK